MTELNPFTIAQQQLDTAAAKLGLTVPSGQTHRFDEEGYVIATAAGLRFGLARR